VAQPPVRSARAFPELVEDPVLMKLREQRPNDLSFNEHQRVLDTSDPVR
jgi:hypothetical protein